MSNDMKKTIAEASRVLKKNGILIAFDRAHPNTLSEVQKDFLLNIDYSESFKIQQQLPEKLPFTRKQNGEHEPRLNEWIDYLNNADLTLSNIAIFTKKNLQSLKLSALSQIPFFIRYKLKRGANLSNYFKLFLFHLVPIIGKFGLIKIYKFSTKLHGKHAPLGKMVFYAKKN